MRSRWFCLNVFILLWFWSSTVLGANLAVKATSWQDIPHGQARFLIFSPSPTEAVTHGLEVKLEPQWHTYWLNPGDSGAAPDIYIVGEQNKRQIPILYPLPERIQVGPITTYGYSEHTVYFLTVPDISDKDLLVADLLVCKEACIPGSVEATQRQLSSGLSAIHASELNAIQKALQNLPSETSLQGTYSASTSALSLTDRWTIPLSQGARLVDLFWLPSQVSDLTQPAFVNDQQLWLFLLDANQSLQDQPKALVVFDHNGERLAQPIQFVFQPPSLLPFLFMALLGGLVLNVMPCVFPIVSLKAFSIANAAGKARTQIRQEHLLYSLGVVACFVVLAFAIVFIRSTGEYIGWGFQLQNPIFVGFLVALFLILGLCFTGLPFLGAGRSVPLPNLFIRLASFSREGGWGAFLTGLLAVIVASPCTVPFMGAAVGFALSQSVLTIVVIFTALGIGMALPFLLLALFPNFAHWLPQPGQWMLTFKKVMGVLLLLTAAWLWWVLWQLMATNSNAALDKHWQPLSMADWSGKQASANPTFINFTADWCVTCKYNEHVVFNNQRVIEYFEANRIQLFKVDWTQKQGDIARKLAEYNRAGVPLYLYYPADSQAPYVLPEVLTVNGLIDKLASHGNAD